MVIVIAIAIVVGILHAYTQMSNARTYGSNKPSYDNPFNYIFTDKY
jgi:hypothetical protein